MVTTTTAAAIPAAATIATAVPVMMMVNNNHGVVIDNHSAFVDHNVTTVVIVDNVSPIDDNVTAIVNDVVRAVRNIDLVDHGTDNFRGRRVGDYRLACHHGHLREQRFAMAKAVEVQAHQAAPLAFEDEELLYVVVAPVLADFVAALVDDAELVAILQHGRIVELHFNVQVFLRPCLCRCGRSRMGHIKPRYSRVMPGRLTARTWIRSLCDAQATQHRYRE